MADESERRWQQSVGPFLTLGIQLALTVVVCFFVGHWMDGRFNTAPLWTLVWLGVGVTGGLIKFIRTAIELGKQEDKRDSGGRSA